MSCSRFVGDETAAVSVFTATHSRANIRHQSQVHGSPIHLLIQSSIHHPFPTVPDAVTHPHTPRIRPRPRIRILTNEY
ncbi:hypothetical protein FVE85_7905 [Porphyridium purpureum]|uniref:Uncharacterized protein n=1 Tax=Porphyridium purpureum TaxID=35688 RepID=A0A5J4YMD1_PORPP|nr:hypothetical protein FVE85_7905 [Porphyridium purpureum]|eukprot:POR9186..scf295_9